VLVPLRARASGSGIDTFEKGKREAGCKRGRRHTIYACIGNLPSARAKNRKVRGWRRVR